MKLRSHIPFVAASLVLFVLMLAWVHPSSRAIDGIWKVWYNMLSGRPFDVVLFSFEWALIFLGAFWLGSIMFTTSKNQSEGLSMERSSAATPDEMSYYKRLQKIEEGPELLKTSAWVEDFRQAIDDRSTSNNVDTDNGAKCLSINVPLCAEPRVGYEMADLGKEKPYEERVSQGSNWLVMDLDEVANFEVQAPIQGNGLLRSTEDLLNEQDELIFGGGLRKKEKGSHGIGEHTPDDCNSDDSEQFSSMRVVYKSARADERIPEFLKKAFEEKKDPSFYNELLDLLST